MSSLKMRTFTLFTTRFIVLFGLAMITATAQANSVRLSGQLPLFADVASGIQLSPNSLYVVYLADQNQDGVRELFSVPSNGSQAPQRLNSPLVTGGRVLSFQISSDSQRVVYRAEQDGVFELYSVPVSGGMDAVKLNADLATGGDVSDAFTISADAKYVVYRADQERDNVFEIYRASIDGQGTVIRLNEPLEANSDVSQFAVGPDGQLVVYLADQNQDEVFELFSTSITGNTNAVRLNNALVVDGDVTSDFLIGPNSQYVVFRADQDENDTVQIYSALANGDGQAVRLNNALATNGDVALGFKISPDGLRVVYQADQEQDWVNELFSAPITGSAPAVKLNTALINGGAVFNFEISPNGQQVVYLANQEQLGVLELFSAPIDGTGQAVKLNHALATGNNVVDYFIAPNSQRVVYQSAPTSDSVFALYTTTMNQAGAATLVDSATLANLSSVPAVRFSMDSTRLFYRARKNSENAAELFSAMVNGSDTPTRVSSSLVSGGNVSSDFLLSPDSENAFYRADQDQDGVIELYTVSLVEDELCLPIQAANGATAVICL